MMTQVVELIKADLFRYTGKTDRKALSKAMGIPGFRFTYILRKCARFKKRSLRGLYYRFLYQRYKYKYGFQIPITTKIGKGLYIGHFGNVVINAKVVIGDNCNIAHGITIGQVNTGKNKGFPVIGNKVWIGTGSVIVGNIKIGDNVLIAPNSYINTDIPSNSLVISNNAAIIKPRENATDGYINNVIE